MGGGFSYITAPKAVHADDYVCIPAEEGKESKYETQLIEVKKNMMLQKNNSHPDLINLKTVFTPYIDVKVHEKNKIQHIQRAVPLIKKSTVGGGNLNYKKFEYFEVSEKYPWLLKNAYFIRPTIKDFRLGRGIGKTEILFHNSCLIVSSI